MDRFASHCLAAVILIVFHSIVREMETRTNHRNILHKLHWNKWHSFSQFTFHHYRKGLVYLSAINLSYLHLHHTDIPTLFNLITSILHLRKNVYFSVQKDLLLLTTQSALIWEPLRLPHTPTLSLQYRSHWLENEISKTQQTFHTQWHFCRNMFPTLQLLLSSLLASYFPKLFPTHITMPSAPAEITTFTETDWVPSETSELSCKSV